MRQAGRYLPEYRATRAKAGSFMGLATNPDFATEVTLQPLERYALDAAILFSDILTVPDAMGLGLRFAHGEGPRFAHPVRDEAAVAALAVPDMDKLRYVFDAVTSIRKALNGRVPLIGFSGSPWTLACYMVEGAGSDDYRLVKTMLYSRPDLMHRILAVNAEAVARLPERADRGRRAGGDGLRQLGRRARRRRVPGVQPGLHARACCEQLQARARRRSACRASSSPRAAARGSRRSPRCGPDVVGLDWTVNLARRARRVGDRVALQGNLDPNVLFAPARRRSRRGASRARELRRRTAPRQSGDTSSISATASASTRRPSTWRRWSRRCTHTRERLRAGRVSAPMAFGCNGCRARFRCR